MANVILPKRPLLILMAALIEPLLPWVCALVATPIVLHVLPLSPRDLAESSAILDLSALLLVQSPRSLEDQLAISNRDRAGATRENIARLEAQLGTLTNEQGKLDGTLRRPENSEVLERNLMINSLIDRKAISWTRIFSDLEKVLPHNVRLIYIRLPQISSTNEVTLDMVVGAQTPEPLQDLLGKLVASPLFGPATVTNYLPPSQNETLHRYRINVNYAQKL